MAIFKMKEEASLEVQARNANTSEKQVALLKKDIKLVEYMPNLCEEALQIVNEALLSKKIRLLHIPQRLMTKEMCWAAVRSNGSNLKNVPEKFVTREMCMEAISTYEDAIWDAPKCFQTKSFFLDAVSVNGKVLEYEYYDSSILTKELCKKAVSNCGMALEFVPKEFMKKDVLLTAVSQDGMALQYVPDELLTEEICKVAISNSKNAKVLNCIPKELVTSEMCTMAVLRDGAALQYVPEKFKTKELCEKAIFQNQKAFYYIPNEFKTKEMCEKVVSKDGYALGSVPKEFKTKELCEVAVSNYGMALEWVPEELKTRELCELAISKNGYALHNVPSRFVTYNLCMKAVSNNGQAFNWVPEKFKTKELCIAAIYNVKEKSNSYIRYFMEEIFRVSEALGKEVVYELVVKQNAQEDLLKHIRIPFPDDFVRKMFKDILQNQNSNLKAFVNHEYFTKAICDIDYLNNVVERYPQTKRAIIEVLPKEFLNSLDIEIKEENKASSAIQNERVYLNVPYEEKDEAKALGARWDKDKKRWYADTKYTDVGKFDRWNPGAAKETEEAEKIER